MKYERLKIKQVGTKYINDVRKCIIVLIACYQFDVKRFLKAYNTC